MMERVRMLLEKIRYWWNYYGPIDEDTDWEPVWE